MDTSTPSPSRLVHVVAFRPLPECEGGVGGFDWYITAAEADARFAEVKTLEEHTMDELFRFDVAVEATEPDEITEEIDGQMDELCDETPDAQTFRPAIVKRARLAECLIAFNAAGGRGVELADEIDRLREELGED